MNTTVVYFGEFLLDLDTGELRDRGGHIIPLAPKPTRALWLIAERRGRLVLRSEMQEALWPDTVVDYDKGLNFCILQIRQALGDSAERPRYVETVPRRGYRMCIEVRTEPPSPSWMGAARESPRTKRVGGRIALGGGLALAVALTSWVWLRAESSAPSEPGIAARPVPAAPEVARRYLEARYLLERGGRDEISTSRRLFAEVVQKAPEFAPGWAGLASAALWDRTQGPPDVALIRLAADRALELDPAQAEAHLRLGDVLARFVRRPRAAADAYQRALAADPRLAEARHHYADLLSSLERHDDAIEQLEIAIELEPASALLQGDAGYIYLFARRYDEAMVACRRAGELVPRSRYAHECDLHASLKAGDRSGALAAAGRLLLALGRQDLAETLPSLDSGDAWAEFWQAYLRELPKLNVPPGEKALMATYARGAMGDLEGALTAFDEAVTQGAHGLTYASTDPRLDPIRGQPRFEAAMESLAKERARPRAGGRSAAPPEHPVLVVTR